MPALELANPCVGMGVIGTMLPRTGRVDIVESKSDSASALLVPVRSDSIRALMALVTSDGSGDDVMLPVS